MSYENKKREIALQKWMLCGENVQSAALKEQFGQLTVTKTLLKHNLLASKRDKIFEYERISKLVNAFH